MILIWIKEEHMLKQCTNSACRRSFSVKAPGAVCPWCGKKYPRLNPSTPCIGKNLLLLNWGASKIKSIKAVRLLMGRGIAEAKELVEKTQSGPVTVEIRCPEFMYSACELFRSAEADFCFTGRRNKSR